MKKALLYSILSLTSDIHRILKKWFYFIIEHIRPGHSFNVDSYKWRNKYLHKESVRDAISEGQGIVLGVIRSEMRFTNS